MKNIVILGAGYAGMLTARKLERKYKNNKDIQITLVDQRDYQLLVFDIYEVATAEEEFTEIDQLKRSVALPVKQVLKNSKIRFIQGEVKEIDQRQKFVTAGIKRIEFDYLICALGSQTDFLNIKGAKEFALPLKSFGDALRIRNQLEFALQAHRLDSQKKNIRFVIAGGGYTGVEFAAELANMVKILAWKNQYPPEKIEILVVEATNQLIPGFNNRLSQDTWFRLKDLGVRVMLSSRISDVGSGFLEFMGGEKLQYDVLVWATGVKAAPLPFMQETPKDKKDRCMVNGNLQLEGHPNIFVLGDQACVMCGGKPAPCSAQDAIDQAEYLTQALPLILKNQRPTAYLGHKHGFIVTMGGQWAIMDYNGWYLTGRLAYIIRQLAHINYLRKVIGWWKAFRLVWFEQQIFSRND